MSSKKKIVTATIYTDEHPKGRKYEGRLLGLINDSEFDALIRHKTVQTRCVTKGTVPIASIIGCKEFDGKDGLQGLRMVMSVKKREGVSCFTKVLLVTEKLSFISFVREDGSSVALTGEKDSWINIDEKEVP